MWNKRRNKCRICVYNPSYYFLIDSYNYKRFYVSLSNHKEKNTCVVAQKRKKNESKPITKGQYTTK